MSKKNLKRKAVFELAPDGFSIHTFELSREITRFEWDSIKRSLYDRNVKGGTVWIRQTDKRERGDFYCGAFAEHGVRIILEHRQPKDGYDSRYIRMTINPRKLLDPNCSYLGILPPEEDIAKKLNKAFHSLMKNDVFPGEMNDYKLTRLDLCVNIQCDNKKLFQELVRVTAKTPTPYGLERVFHKEKDKKKERLYNKHYIHFSCGSYDLVLYDKTYQMTKEGLKVGFEKWPQGVLRYEMQLKRPLIRKLEKGWTFESITDLLDFFVTNSANFLIARFQKDFPPAYHHKDGDLFYWLCEICDDSDPWFSMRGIYSAVKKYGADGFSLEDLPDSKESIKKAMKRYQNAGVSPVPLRKNFSAQQMPNFSLLLEQIFKGSVSVEYIRFK